MKRIKKLKTYEEILEYFTNKGLVTGSHSDTAGEDFSTKSFLCHNPWQDNQITFSDPGGVVMIAANAVTLEEYRTSILMNCYLMTDRLIQTGRVVVSL